MVMAAVDRLKLLVDAAPGDTKNLADLGVDKILDTYGGFIVAEVVTLWNWVFERGAEFYPGGKYEPIDAAWLEETVSIRVVTEILKELAEQSRMAWIFPFFKSQGQRALLQVARAGLVKEAPAKS